MDERTPYLKPPLSIEGGATNACSLEESIGQNIQLLLTSPLQEMAKTADLAADPHYGTDLPHHRFTHGSSGDLVRQIKLSVKRNEPRLILDKIEFCNDKPGRYSPFRYVRIIGKVKDTGLPLELEFDVEA